jgi:hypothetical protein
MEQANFEGSFGGRAPGEYSGCPTGSIFGIQHSIFDIQRVKYMIKINMLLPAAAAVGKFFTFASLKNIEY